MRRAAGQVGHFLNRLLRLAVALVVLAGLGLVAVAWRLEQGPVEVTWLARQAEAAFNASGGPTRLVVGDAAVGWAGWREGHRSPIEITLRRLRVVDGDGAVRAELPDAELSLSLRWLLGGVVAPRALEMRGLSLRAGRSADGVFSLGLLPDGAAGTAGESSAAEQAVLARLAALGGVHPSQLVVLSRRAGSVILEVAVLHSNYQRLTAPSFLRAVQSSSQEELSKVIGVLVLAAHCEFMSAEPQSPPPSRPLSRALLPPQATGAMTAEEEEEAAMAEALAAAEAEAMAEAMAA